MPVRDDAVHLAHELILVHEPFELYLLLQTHMHLEIGAPLVEDEQVALSALTFYKLFYHLGLKKIHSEGLLKVNLRLFWHNCHLLLRQHEIIA